MSISNNVYQILSDFYNCLETVMGTILSLLFLHICIFVVPCVTAFLHTKLLGTVQYHSQPIVTWSNSLFNPWDQVANGLLFRP